MSDRVVITYVCGVHSNTRDPFSSDQFALTRIWSGDYKNCDYQCLKEIMVQMAIDPFVNVRAVTELL